MMYKVMLTEQAELDLRNIYEYIAFELLSPDNAAGQLDRLEENIIKLEMFPERFSAYEKEPWYSRGLRKISVDNYLVFYISDIDKAIVTIIRVMYEGRDVERQLKNYMAGR